MLDDFRVRLLAKAKTLLRIERLRADLKALHEESRLQWKKYYVIDSEAEAWDTYLSRIVDKLPESDREAILARMSILRGRATTAYERQIERVDAANTKIRITFATTLLLFCLASVALAQSKTPGLSVSTVSLGFVLSFGVSTITGISLFAGPFQSKAVLAIPTLLLGFGFYVVSHEAASVAIINSFQSHLGLAPDFRLGNLREFYVGVVAGAVTSATMIVLLNRMRFVWMTSARILVEYRTFALAAQLYAFIGTQGQGLATSGSRSKVRDQLTRLNFIVRNGLLHSADPTERKTLRPHLAMFTDRLTNLGNWALCPIPGTDATLRNDLFTICRCAAYGHWGSLPLSDPPKRSFKRRITDVALSVARIGLPVVTMVCVVKANFIKDDPPILRGVTSLWAIYQLLKVLDPDLKESIANMKEIPGILGSLRDRK